jgi:hypothetical protein
VDIATAKEPIEVLLTVTETLPGGGLLVVEVVEFMLPPPHPAATIDTTRGIKTRTFIMAANSLA